MNANFVQINQLILIPSTILITNKIRREFEQETDRC